MADARLPLYTGAPAGESLLKRTVKDFISWVKAFDNGAERNEQC